MDQVMAEEEEKYSMHSQSRKALDEEEDGEDSDDSAGHNVFYKASELIVS